MDLLISGSVSANAFDDFATAPTDGRVIYVQDDFGAIDIARHDDNEWTAEFGNTSGEWVAWAPMSIGGFGAAH